MPEFTFTLNLHVEARDDQAVLELAKELRAFIEEKGPIKFRSAIEIDDIEEL